MSKTCTILCVGNYADALTQAVADELVASRAAKRWTQRQVIDATGISKSKLIRIEAGRQPINTYDIALITDALDVEPQELMQRAEVRARKLLEGGTKREPVA